MLKFNLFATLLLVVTLVFSGCDKAGNTGSEGSEESEVDSTEIQRVADSTAAAQEAQETESSKKPLAEMFEGTLKTALETSGLAESLASGEYTIFMPSEEALAELKDKLADQAEAEKILKNHIIAEKIAVPDMMPDQELETLGGGKLKLEIKDGLMYVQGAKIGEEHDIEGTNGYIHKIEGVLLP